MDEALPDSGFNAQIKVRLRDDPSLLGDAVCFTVDVRNLSRYRWPAQGRKPVRLAYHWLHPDGRMLVFDGERTLLPQDIELGQIVSLDCAVLISHPSGLYILGIRYGPGVRCMV